MARFPLKTLAAAGAFSLAAAAAAAGPYVQTNLVSDLPGLAALTDPALVNPWGIAASATSPFWVSDQGRNASTLYSVTGPTTVAKVNINPPSGLVAIPTTGGGPQGPTGQVFNGGSGFAVGNGGNGAAARFIFANLNGTISAWNGGAAAVLQATVPGAVYTGLAINSAQSRLYAANGAVGTVDVFDGGFAKLSLPGAFTDPNLPAGLVPFNVQDIGGKVYVTYAPAGRAAQIAAGAGSGVVAVFDEAGVFQRELVRGGALASPWGVALAPAGFGVFGGDLLVGNFSFADSAINAFNLTTGALVGAIPIDAGLGNTAGGLWALTFGNGVAGGDPNTLYILDAINGEQDGLLAAITVPEPPAFAVLLGGLGLLGLRRRRAEADRLRPGSRAE